MAKTGATTKAATTTDASALTPSAATATKPYTVLARRYRSRDFSEVVGQDPISRTLQNAIATHRTAHAYLFCGTRGVGKTSMARIFARALNRDAGLSESDAIGEAILRGEDLDVIEIDGASNRGIDDARDLIAGAGLAPTRGKYRIYIIDEVHMLTTPAFNALLKTMEEPPSHVKFILCTTEPHKVPQTIQSRCQRFDFRNIPTKQIAAHLGAIAKGEGIVVTEEVLLAVGRLANGSMRDGLSLLDRLLAATSGTVDATVLEEVFGLPDDEILLSIVEACVCERPADALLHGSQLLERGSGVEQALELLAERFRWILVAAAAGSDSELLEVAASMRDRVSRIAQQSDTAYCAHAIALCDATARNARGSSAPRALYDACLARLALASRFAAGAALLAGAGSAGGTGPKKAMDLGAPRAPRAPELAGQPQAAAARPASLTTASQSPVPASLAPPTRTAPSVVPASNAAAPQEPVSNVAQLLRRLEAAGEKSSKDCALADMIEVLEFSGEHARVAIRADGPGGYLVSNPEPLRALLARAAGRTVRVTLEAREEPRSASVAKPLSASDPTVTSDPLVRRAMELFDAHVVAVTARAHIERSEQGTVAEGGEVDA